MLLVAFPSAHFAMECLVGHAKIGVTGLGYSQLGPSRHMFGDVFSLSHGAFSNIGKKPARQDLNVASPWAGEPADSKIIPQMWPPGPAWSHKWPLWADI